MTTATTLHGKWLTLARAAWLVVAIFYVAAYIATFLIGMSKAPQLVPASSGITDAEFLAGIARMGVSTEGYLAFLRWSDVLIHIVYLVLGFFIFWRKSDDWMALLTSYLFITFLGPFETLAEVNSTWAVLGDASAILNSILLFLWFFVFPDGHFVPRWMRWIFLLLLSTQVWRIFQPAQYERNFAPIGLVIFSGILIAQVYRYRHAGVTQRQQIKWVVYGIVVGTIPLLAFMVLYIAVLNARSPLLAAIALNFFGNFIWMFFLIVLPISLTLAILRSRLFDIDLIIRKTVTYSIVVALLLFVYFGSVILLQQLFASVSGQRSEVITVLSTLAIAALFVPLRNWIQSAIDRRFYRKKYDAQQVLTDFANTVRDETDLEKLTARLMQVVDETMQPKSVSVWLRMDENAKTLLE